MDGNLSQGTMVPSIPPYGGIDLQGSMRARHQHNSFPQQGSAVHTSNFEGFPLCMSTVHAPDQPIPQFGKGEIGKNPVSDEDDPNSIEEGNDVDENRGKKGSPWQRVKWTDKMVRLLITSVSYIGEELPSDSSGMWRRKFSVLQKKGKWKSISKVMAERGCNVSPQQCEDKFNDLNKRYKKLNDMLGRGTSCQVVENPALLDVIDFLTEKEKDDVRKILSSKQLFYEEMCSYHNGNRLHLPHDPALQRSLMLALRSRDDLDDGKRNLHDDPDEDDQDIETDDRDDYEENHVKTGKRSRQVQGHDDLCLSSSWPFQDCDRSSHSHSHSHSQVIQTDMNNALPENTRPILVRKHWIEAHTLKLEQQKVQIQAEMLELEKQRFKWERISRKRDHELEKLRMENERMKLENDRMALELKRKEMDADYN